MIRKGGCWSSERSCPIELQRLLLFVVVAVVVRADRARIQLDLSRAKPAAATALWFGFAHLVEYLFYASLFGGALTAHGSPTNTWGNGTPRK
jgi:hypothetical protein